ncbi:TrmB family transcriptional regulator [Sulfolobus acidocaldarius SUSAZ]|nr:TrmB family transcriptional regulator [Sulfolobus acidocaldarius SUSAZ]
METVLQIPYQKKTQIEKLLEFIYGLNEKEVQLIFRLLYSDTKLNIEELAEEFKVSKALISKSLSELANKGLIEREKVSNEGRKGRPIYVYYVDREQLFKRINRDLEELVQASIAKLKEYIFKS